jgi:shikimate dehydrogenase
VTRKTFLTGLIGAPIAHSASPAMHEQAARALGVGCHYQLIELAGADSAELQMLMAGIRRLGFAGVNITYPYKEAVVALIDELSPDAAAMQAVNTVVVRDNRLIGHNTDTSGFAKAAANLPPDLMHGSVGVIGAGGVGKAIAFALVRLGATELRLFDADRPKAEKLSMMLKPRARAVVAGTIEDALKGVVGVVNATPVGMLPNRGIPIPEALLHGGLWVADAVYFPLWTPLLTAAKRKGARVVTGRELAVYQAADAFELFTGLSPSAAEMGKAFDRVMSERREE